MIKDKDVFLMKILDKVTLANNRQLMILAGYRDPSVIRKRLNALKKEGYIVSDKLGDHLVYTLSQAGLNEIERTRRPYEIKGIKSEHEELVTEAACLIYISGKRSITDMVFDHEMNSLKQFKRIGHKPDIVFSPHQAIEVELSSKRSLSYGDKSGLEDNFRNNSRYYDIQTWIIPRHKEGLRKRLTQLSERYGGEKKCNILTVEDLKEFISRYDPSDNCMRNEPVIGIPSPLEYQTKEVILND